MATSEIEKLDERVTRLEDRTASDIVGIHAKIDSMTALLNRSLVESAKQSCPSPGACIGLSESLKNQIVAHNSTMLRVERLELRILDMEKWQGRLFGGITVIMTILTLFAPAIRKLLNLE